ncbi:Mov34/MPN/PAD-1 family protein [Bacillus salipaludis]|uniref:Mov34/MPN/PAD-1 family protein n=1 Tax=Bacillus salipaludis TaxID=2547811 RepID=A0AA90TWF8_9BACI|nr:Mov34/MPN/PAD-1 family protein [Bacillus salipaludis]MDQ6600735.1 Mov34/MPN/PAD-1 family protein [Bacillus salipaludis]
MIQAGLQNLPNETCGFLSGKYNNITTWTEMKNSSTTPNSFFIKKEFVEEALKTIEIIGEEVIALAHSHPTSNPIPSYLDLRSHPDSTVKMVIVSYKYKNPLIKCYDINKLTYKEVPIYVNK